MEAIDIGIRREDYLAVAQMFQRLLDVERLDEVEGSQRDRPYGESGDHCRKGPVTFRQKVR